LGLIIISLGTKNTVGSTQKLVPVYVWHVGYEMGKEGDCLVRRVLLLTDDSM
jgi:hypothetical protein